MAVLRPTGKTVTVCRRCIAVERLQLPHVQRRANVCRFTVCLLSAREGDVGVLTDEQTSCLSVSICSRRPTRCCAGDGAVAVTLEMR